jgi:tRNA A-37 threonylcarbamoyl transferase component Bud32
LRQGATVDDARATIETVARLPPEWRGKPVTLAIPEFEGDVTLFVDGRPQVDRSLGFAHAWRVDAAASDSPEVVLRLELAPALFSALSTAPRLSPTTDGDDWYRFVRGATYQASSIATTILGFLALLYSVLFALDRRRPAHGWFALQGYIGLIVTARVVLDGPRLLGGARELQLDLLAGTLGFIAAAFFASAHFRIRAPSRVLWLLPLVVAPLSFTRSTSATSVFAQVACAATVAAFAWIATTLFRVRATVEDKVGALTLAGGYVLFLVLASTDLTAIVGLGDHAGGFRGGVLGMGVCASLQTTLLARDYVRSIRRADAHAAELEAQSEEVRLLNVELRRQIADRSKQLAEALARIGGVAPRPAPFAPGDCIHERYRVVRSIGEGGMGAVYEVVRLADQRRFALKVLTNAATGVALARLAREAQVAAQVSHEHLVSIADVDVSETGALYIVMELVEGPTLADLHARYGDLAWALPILRQVAAGIAALHAEGIVHRDLKPANVLVARPDDPEDPGTKIADFGIARIADALPAAGDAAIDPHADTAMVAGTAQPSPLALTQAGFLLGTPVYMAPELAQGARDATPAADLWAFGVMAYQLIAGSVPFDVPPVLEVIARRAWRAPAALDEARCGARVAALVARCLSATPESRPTAQECVAALR